MVEIYIHQQNLLHILPEYEQNNQIPGLAIIDNENFLKPYYKNGQKHYPHQLTPYCAYVEKLWWGISTLNFNVNVVLWEYPPKVDSNMWDSLYGNTVGKIKYVLQDIKRIGEYNVVYKQQGYPTGIVALDKQGNPMDTVYPLDPAIEYRVLSTLLVSQENGLPKPVMITDPTLISPDIKFHAIMQRPLGRNP